MQVKETPILFSAPMVRAVRAGIKSKTRRVIKPQPAEQLFNIHGTDQWAPPDPQDSDAPDGMRVIRCPYGKAGDRLWGRETWRVGAWNSSNQSIAVDYRADNCAQRAWLEVPDYDQFEKLWIASTDQAMAAGLPLDENGGYQWKPGEAPTVWRPSIFMPRWASRITLEIVSIGVERVQDISEEDAQAEGVTLWNADQMTYRVAFADLWDQINGKRGYTWASSPWVWVVEFKRLEASNV